MSSEESDQKGDTGIKVHPTAAQDDPSLLGRRSFMHGYMALIGYHGLSASTLG